MTHTHERQANQVTTVIFDVGGVIVLDYVDKKVVDLAKKYHKDPDLMLQLRKKFRRLADSGQISDLKFWIKLLEAVDVEASPDDWKFEHYEQEIKGGIEIPKQLKQKGYRIAILSNDSKESSQYRRQKYGFDDIFDEIIISSQYGYIKPDPKIYEVALEKLHVPPSQCLFIDDREENIQASVNIGMQALLFANVRQAIEDLRTFGIELK